MTPSKRLSVETSIGWMETRESEVSQYHCPSCDQIFQYATDENGTEKPPNFCPMCGKKNARAWADVTP